MLTSPSYMGLRDGNNEEHILINIPITLEKSFVKNNFVKFKLNFNIGGIINEHNPYIDISESCVDESRNIEQTINNINLLIYSVDEIIFKNDNKWEFSSIKSTYIAGDDIMKPLIKID